MTTERSGVEIDYCPQCRGVWLDRDELEKIIERSIAQLAPDKAQSEPTRPAWAVSAKSSSAAKDLAPRRHRDAFLDDLFDF